MRTTRKFLTFAVGGVLAFVALALLSVWLLVNPNHYKGRIAAAFKEATGRELELQGDIKLSLFPWIALELGPASLGNPPGFGTEPFVSFQHAAVRAKFLPLIQGRLEIAHVEIDGLDVRLQKNPKGKGNWEGFGHAAAAADSAAADKGASGEARLAGLPGIRVMHSRVSYPGFTLENVSVETAASDGVVPVAIGFDVNRGEEEEHALVSAHFDLSQSGPKRFRMAAFSVTAQVSLPHVNGTLHSTLATPGVDLDMDGQTFGAPAFTIDLAGAHVSGNLLGTRILDAPAVTGAVTLEPVLIREFLPRWGLTGPRTRDPKAFSTVSGSATFVYGSNALRFDAINVAMDDTHLQGSFAVSDIDARALKFALVVDKIDLDRYLAPLAETQRPPGKGGGPTGKRGGQPGARGDGDGDADAGDEGEAEAGEPPAVPGVGVKGSSSVHAAAPPISAEGKFAVGSLHVSRLDMSDVQLTLVARDEVVHVFPLTAEVDGGHYSGNITLDHHLRPPTVSVDEHLSGIDMARLLATNGNNVHLSGQGNFNLKASGRGLTVAAILKSLNGHVDGSVSQGAVEGIDLGFELGRAAAAVNGLNGQIAPAAAVVNGQLAPAAENTRRTPFDAFKTSAEITDGVARTHDLTISSHVLKLTGQGSTNLATTEIDFHLLADTLRTTHGVRIQLPVIVTGTTSNPAIRPDVDALAKGRLKEKLRDVLHDKLRGLFGKP